MAADDACVNVAAGQHRNSIHEGVCPFVANCPTDEEHAESIRMTRGITHISRAELGRVDPVADDTDTAVQRSGKV
ncbi:hypothetical protein GCM10027267_21470 [Paramicrobacterium agarici]